MENLSNLKTVKNVLNQHGFSFSKSLGQNFLINPSVCPKIASLGGAKDAFAIEIGTGVGVLTSELAKIAKKVLAIEIDERLLPVLSQTLEGFDNIEIINDDVLNIDLEYLIKEKASGLDVVICANLPYYITSPILMHILESKLPVKSITVMVQKEAAQRICAKPGTRDAGAISLAVSYFSEPKKLFDVSRGSFYPAPNVDSAVIRLDIRSSPAVNPKSEKDMFSIIKAGFSQRRKMLINPLSSLWKMDKQQVKLIFEQAGVDLKARAENLSLQQFASLSDAKNKV